RPPGEPDAPTGGFGAPFPAPTALLARARRSGSNIAVVAEGKTTSLQPASPAEVARTLLARAKDSPTLPEAGAAPNDRTLQSRTDSGVRARDQALTADETPRMRTRIAERATHFEIERYQPVGALGEGGM